MQSKSIFPQFWRHRQDGTVPSDNATSSEVPVNHLDANTAAQPAAPHVELLSCQDIYHASGILSPHSKYGVNKIVEMLKSKHIRELSKELKRASVLMALDAAETPVDEVLQDATRRLHALNAYETAQQKQCEDFEALKIRENASIQAELDRLTAHYAARIQHNLDQVDREKEALRHWRTSKEEESQRISEAVALCGKQPAAEAVHAETTRSAPHVAAVGGTA
jgi:hypothetical protein